MDKNSSDTEQITKSKDFVLDCEMSCELDLGDPPQELKEYSKKELGEDPDTIAKVLQDFRDLIYERGECNPHRMDDKYLTRFLRARGFHLEKAHRLMVKYYNFKEDNPEYHEDVNPLDLRHIGEDDIMTVLPYREQTGRRILLYRIGNWDPSKFGIEELFKATLVILELGVLEQRAQILGGVCIFDLADITMQHAWHVTPSVARKVVELMVTSFPMKTYAIHILNQSWVFEVIFAIFRPLLDARMRDRIFFHGADMESLHQHIDPKYLPEVYGGSREECPYYMWFDSLKYNVEVMDELASLGYRSEDKDVGVYKPTRTNFEE
ncbi:alpha-tocopherol transfer protein-like [Ctenocephalides felis]|uniref:alpha-tocopherol transfer protein-like n=1 Tax=Ctenocephalides felis TaxID=7515 RepID=UPI000E6E4F10|nr:alpha-tocopherol transfer protein-like [Ctenocephalides felis]